MPADRPDPQAASDAPPCANAAAACTQTGQPTVPNGQSIGQPAAPTSQPTAPNGQPASLTGQPTATADHPAAPAHRPYRGRIAPTPSGMLHQGHARTFKTAWQRARAAGGTLIYRQEDIDPRRCTPEFAAAAIEHLREFGLDWDEGPGCTPPGPHAPYCQSQRTHLYLQALCTLITSGHAYPDAHSRADLRKALQNGSARPAPPQFGEQDTEAIFPVSWRPAPQWFEDTHLRAAVAARIAATSIASAHLPELDALGTPRPKPQQDANAVTWRFRVPDTTTVRFTDGHYGEQAFTTGTDFGDFTLWRRDNVPAYELAVVVDDIAMEITEVVRGADLLRSTARQLLLYAALVPAPPPPPAPHSSPAPLLSPAPSPHFQSPAFYHCPLLLDPLTGHRLSKRKLRQLHP